MGRIEKFDAVKKKEYIRLLTAGGRRMACAAQVGVNARTVEKHMHKYPAFAEDVSYAETTANERVEGAMYLSAIGGNVTAQQVWLYNRSPERWKNAQRHEVSGEIDLNVYDDPRKALLDKLGLHFGRLEQAEAEGLLDGTRALSAGGGSESPPIRVDVLGANGADAAAGGMADVADPSGEGLGEDEDGRRDSP